MGSIVHPEVAIKVNHWQYAGMVSFYGIAYGLLWLLVGIEVFDKKFGAMECLVSQGYAGAYNRKRTESSDGGFGGGFVAYGEGYIRMNAEVHYLLPITPYARRRQGDSDHEVMARYSWRLPMPVTDSLEQRPASIPPEA